MDVLYDREKGNDHENTEWENGGTVRKVRFFSNNPTVCGEKDSNTFASAPPGREHPGSGTKPAEAGWQRILQHHQATEYEFPTSNRRWVITIVKV